MVKKRIIVVVCVITFGLTSYGQVQIGNDIDGEMAGDGAGFGTSLSSDGSIVAVGANFNAGGGAASGHVRVFENINGNWLQIGSDIDGDPGDQSGQSVCLSADGTILAVGEPIDNDVAASSGQVRVYENIGGTWTQIGSEINGDIFNAQTGRGLDISADGSIVVAGAFGANSFTGVVRVYENQGGTWVQIGNDLNGDETLDLYGYSVSISDDGSIVATGAIGNPSSQEIGYVKIVENVGGNWSQIGNNIVGAATGYGTSVSLSSNGSIVAIGGPGDSPEGKVQVFQNVGGNWVQIGSDLLGETSGDLFGSSVSLSADGNTLAVSARNNSSSATNAGRTYIFRNQGGTWVQIGSPMDGEAADDFSGRNIHLSSDASTVSIGTPANDGNGTSSGHVRVYDLTALYVSLNELDNFAVIRLFPNPTEDYCKIEMEDQLMFDGVSIYDASGKIVLTSKQTHIDLQHLPAGKYVVKIVTQKGDFSRNLTIH
jgi:hypothetical protein|tara:strand:- start:9805 stop:11259 length:1455 start_codon:yes stop_codon:yes gene_type:complete